MAMIKRTTMKISKENLQKELEKEQLKKNSKFIIGGVQHYGTDSQISYEYFSDNRCIINDNGTEFEYYSSYTPKTGTEEEWSKAISDCKRQHGIKKLQKYAQSESYNVNPLIEIEELFHVGKDHLIEFVPECIAEKILVLGYTNEDLVTILKTLARKDVRMFNGCNLSDHEILMKYCNMSSQEARTLIEETRTKIEERSTKPAKNITKIITEFLQ